MNVSEVNGLNLVYRVGGDIQIEEQPAREDPDGEDGVEHVTVDVAVHDTEHHTVLPSLEISLFGNTKGLNTNKTGKVILGQRVCQGGTNEKKGVSTKSE